MQRSLSIPLAMCLMLGCEDGAEPAPAEVPAADVPAADAGVLDAAADLPPQEPELPERRIVEVRGDVRLDGERAAVDMAIGEASTLVTGDDGYAILTVEKGSTIEVRHRTELTFGKSETASISVSLVVGTLWSFMADDSSYEVVTPNAVAGVRGTIFFVQVQPKKRKRQADKSYVCACHGKVAIRGKNAKSFDEIVHSPSENHKAFDIVTRGKRQKKRAAKRRNHTDSQKMALMPYMSETE